MKDFISFAEYHIKNTDSNFLEKYWDYERNKLDPYKIGKCSHKKVWIKCQSKKYHKSYKMTCANFTNRQRCPYCNSFASHKVHYFDSLGFLHHDIAKMIVEDERNGLTWEDTYKISPCSTKKFYIKCPVCGSKSKTKKRLGNIQFQGFSCEFCSDGISYPNKLMCNLLYQLGIEFETEYSPKWADNKRYDFYIPSLKLIIEMDGGLGHGHRNSFNDPIESKFNDFRKTRMAQENGLKIIRVDCDYPNSCYRFNFIKNNVMKNLPNFNYEKVDWALLEEKSNNSRCREVWELWNKGMRSTKEISECTNINRSVVTSYLKRGFEVGIVDYDSKKEYENRKYLTGKNHPMYKKHHSAEVKKRLGKPIVCLTTKRIFDTAVEGAEYYNCNRGHISYCCKGKRKYCGKLPDGTKLVWRYLVWKHNKKYRIK